MQFILSNPKRTLTSSESHVSNMDFTRLIILFSNIDNMH